MAVAAVSVWRCSERKGAVPRPNDTAALSPRAAALVGWCGMRGIVTLAAALALPSGGPHGAPFPYRDLILSTAFAVVLGTLVVQGLTLRPLMGWLRLEDDGAVEHEVRLARVAALRAALAATAVSGRTETADLLRRRYDLQLRRAKAELEVQAASAVDSAAAGTTELPGPSPADADLVRAAINAEREQISALRTEGTIGDAAFQRVEEELDWRERDLQQLLRSE
jgi:monovalent cation/hydrogen antiporter